MTDTIASIETFFVSIPNSESYLPGKSINRAMEQRGYLVSPVNNTVYPSDFRSVLVKVTTRDGCVGWGETYGLMAPKAIAEIHRDLMAPYLIGRNPLHAQSLWDEVYNLMRVRGYTGYYCDALAAIDIALWDICGKLLGQPISTLLGGRRHDEVPAYLSGIKGKISAERTEVAQRWVDAGFNLLKLHAVHSDDLVADVAAVRNNVGPSVELAVDLHWQHSSGDASRLLHQLSTYNISFAEAPVKPEDIEGLVALSQRTSVPLAAGEEWRTVHEAVPRVTRGALSLLQPEMGHTGITQFARIATLAEAFNVHLAPHSTIGCGIFLAASLQASSALPNLRFHEFHPSIVERCSDLLDRPIQCESGYFRVEDRIGLGVEPSEKMLAIAEPI